MSQNGEENIVRKPACQNDQKFEDVTFIIPHWTSVVYYSPLLLKETHITYQWERKADYIYVVVLSVLIQAAHTQKSNKSIKNMQTKSVRYDVYVRRAVVTRRRVSFHNSYSQ